MNIPSAIMQMLGSDKTANLISSLLGVNQDQTKRATNAVVPSLLAGLSGLASTPQGAQRLAETVSRQDTGVVDNLAGAFSGQGAQLAEQGSGLLGSLLGGGTTSKLGSVLSRFTGVGEGSTGELLVMLTPIILGFLSKQQKDMGLNPSGLASLLGGQKDNIRAAMPAGLETVLSSALPGGSQLLGGGARMSPTDRRASYEQAPRRIEETPNWISRGVYSEAGRGGREGTKWAVPLLLVLGALTMALLLWSNRDRSRQVRPMGASVTASGNITGKDDSIVSDTTRLIGQASSALAGIKDSASAEAAVPKLQRINQQMSNLSSAWKQLSASARSTATSALQPQVAKLKQSAQAILSQPGTGTGETVRPHVEQLMENLNAFSTQ